MGQRPPAPAGALLARMDKASGTDRLAIPDPEDRAGIRVLVAEDEPTLRSTCVSVLRSYGYDVSSAEDGREALERIREHDYDIMLVDLYIEEGSGIEVLNAVMERRPETLVIIMTGNPSVRSNLEALGAGAWDYLPKPFSGTHLEVLMGRAAHAVMRQRGAGGAGRVLLSERMTQRPYDEAREAVLREFERAYLRALLDRTEGTVPEAARAADIDPAELSRLLEKHGLHRHEAPRAES